MNLWQVLDFFLHAPVENGSRRSTGSKVVQTDEEWCFLASFLRRQDDKGPVVVLEGGVEIER